MLLIKFLFCLTLLLTFSNCHSQFKSDYLNLSKLNLHSNKNFWKTIGADIINKSDTNIHKDTLTISECGINKKIYLKKFKTSSPWIPISEIAGLNLLVGAFNTYWQHEPWAKISFKSVRNNFVNGFKYDEDKFTVNQILHPFHGSLYFNIARSNGYNFWQSIPFAAFGSLMWEFIMENDATINGQREHPAKNDFISTTLGGIMLGEMGSRTSTFLFHESPLCKWWGVPGNILANILNIPRFYKKAIRGDFDDPHYGVYDSAKSDPSLRIFAGINFNKGLDQDNQLRYFFQFYYTYGNLRHFSPNDNFEPFDYFRLRFGFTLFGPNRDNYLYAYANLWARKKYFSYQKVYNDNTKKEGDSIVIRQNFIIAGLFQDYDYIYNKPDFEIGAQSAGPGIIWQNDKINLFISAHSNLIILGAIGTRDTLVRVNDKDYIFGTGIKCLFDSHWFPADFLRVYFEFRYFSVNTIFDDERDEKNIRGNIKIFMYDPRLLILPFKGKFENFGFGISYPFYQKFETLGGYVKPKVVGKEFKIFLSYTF